MILRYLLKGMILPPFLQLLMLLAALLFWRWRPRLARWLTALSIVSLWLLATPMVANGLLESLETRHDFLTPEQADRTDAQAIVILAAGVVTNAHEYGQPMASNHTLMRLRYGAYLQRRTDLPILVSGGSVFGETDETLAGIMARELETLYRVPVRWREQNSRTTHENATYSAEMLAEAGIDRILLVTEAFHMPRSVQAFENQGLEVIPAPTTSYGMTDTGILGLTPSALALNGSSMAIHEYLGMLAYRVLY
ncbi:YdcF family protein [Saccharospirillum salsuginis]|uniref:DUF218 domain-containing protein n=1 Tax=Saccharospirillum salsuginis TaxID=418750 RepID=A0A918KA73_9GAMM|nr:YdcF family protein [Saccharospirillum salsuginis]GGX56695.1 hypothetical protein GCM10007392_25190 [Saccharospirillum salsuginis]